VPIRVTSVAEDPSYRQVNGGGTIHPNLYLISVQVAGDPYRQRCAAGVSQRLYSGDDRRAGWCGRGVHRASQGNAADAPRCRPGPGSAGLIMSGLKKGCSWRSSGNHHESRP
jgi:hypothetical protein